MPNPNDPRRSRSMFVERAEQRLNEKRVDQFGRPIPRPQKEFLTEEGTVGEVPREVPLPLRESVGRTITNVVEAGADVAKDIALTTPAGHVLFPRTAIAANLKTADDAFFGPVERLGNSLRQKFGGEWSPEAEHFGIMDAATLAGTVTGIAPGAVGTAAKSMLRKAAGRVLTQVKPFSYDVSEKWHLLKQNPLRTAVAAIRDEPLYNVEGMKSLYDPQQYAAAEKVMEAETKAGVRYPMGTNTAAELARDYLVRKRFGLRPRYSSERMFKSTGPSSVEFNVDDVWGNLLARDVIAMSAADAQLSTVSAMRNIIDWRRAAQQSGMNVEAISQIVPWKIRNALEAPTFLSKEPRFKYVEDFLGKGPHYTRRPSETSHPVLRSYDLEYAIPDKAQVFAGKAVLQADDMNRMGKGPVEPLIAEPSHARYYDAWDWSLHPDEIEIYNRRMQQLRDELGEFSHDVLQGNTYRLYRNLRKGQGQGVPGLSRKEVLRDMRQHYFPLVDDMEETSLASLLSRKGLNAATKPAIVEGQIDVREVFEKFKR